jgi:hypothetical protein
MWAGKGANYSIFSHKITKLLIFFCCGQDAKGDLCLQGTEGLQIHDGPSHCRRLVSLYTDKKENQMFLIYKEIQNGAVANSYITNGLLIYG